MSSKKQSLTATTYDKRGRIIAVGVNSYTQTHPKQKILAEKANMHGKEFLHAEINSIIKSRGRTIHKIKIERYDKQGNPKLAKPCPICEIAIKEAGIKLVEYTVG